MSFSMRISRPTHRLSGFFCLNEKKRKEGTKGLAKTETSDSMKAQEEASESVKAKEEASRIFLRAMEIQDLAKSGAPTRRRRTGRAALSMKSKKPQSPFFEFVNDKRDDILKEVHLAGRDSGVDAKRQCRDLGAVVKRAGVKWKEMSAAAQKPYLDTYNRRRNEYARELEEFVAAGGILPQKLKRCSKGLVIKQLEDPQCSEAAIVDAPGSYIITNPATLGSGLRVSSSTPITELVPGTCVNVLEVIPVVDEERVRARIEEPRGYISLLNTGSGDRWARPAVPQAPQKQEKQAEAKVCAVPPPRFQVGDRVEVEGRGNGKVITASGTNGLPPGLYGLRFDDGAKAAIKEGLMTPSTRKAQLEKLYSKKEALEMQIAALMGEIHETKTAIQVASSSPRIGPRSLALWSSGKRRAEPPSIALPWQQQQPQQQQQEQEHQHFDATSPLTQAEEPALVDLVRQRMRNDVLAKHAGENFNAEAFSPLNAEKRFVKRRLVLNRSSTEPPPRRLVLNGAAQKPHSPLTSRIVDSDFEVCAPSAGRELRVACPSTPLSLLTIQSCDWQSSRDAADQSMAQSDSPHHAQPEACGLEQADCIVGNSDAAPSVLNREDSKLKRIKSCPEEYFTTFAVQPDADKQAACAASGKGSDTPPHTRRFLENSSECSQSPQKRLILNGAAQKLHSPLTCRHVDADLEACLENPSECSQSSQKRLILNGAAQKLHSPLTCRHVDANLEACLPSAGNSPLSLLTIESCELRRNAAAESIAQTDGAQHAHPEACGLPSFSNTPLSLLTIESCELRRNAAAERIAQTDGAQHAHPEAGGLRQEVRIVGNSDATPTVRIKSTPEEFFATFALQSDAEKPEGESQVAATATPPRCVAQEAPMLTPPRPPPVCPPLELSELSPAAAVAVPVAPASLEEPPKKWRRKTLNGVGEENLGEKETGEDRVPELPADQEPKRKRTPKLAGDKEAPKKPHSPFSLFVNQNRQEIVRTLALQHKRGVGAVCKEAGTMWKEMDAAARKPYQDRFEQDCEEYHQLVGKAQDPVAKMKRLRRRTLGAPRPHSPFMMYRKENTPLLLELLGGGRWNVGAVSKKAKEVWKGMDAASRRPYEEQFQRAREAWIPNEGRLKQWRQYRLRLNGGQAVVDGEAPAVVEGQLRRRRKTGRRLGKGTVGKLQKHKRLLEQKLAALQAQQQSDLEDDADEVFRPRFRLRRKTALLRMTPFEDEQSSPIGVEEPEDAQLEEGGAFQCYWHSAAAKLPSTIIRPAAEIAPGAATRAALLSSAALERRKKSVFMESLERQFPGLAKTYTEAGENVD